MDQDKNITTASIEGEVENVSANDIKEEHEATVTEHKKKNKKNGGLPDVSDCPQKESKKISECVKMYKTKII